MGIGPGPIPPEPNSLVIQFKLFSTLDDLTEENINEITDDTIELLRKAGSWTYLYRQF